MNLIYEMCEICKRNFIKMSKDFLKIKFYKYVEIFMADFWGVR